jgi:L-ribulose-5-phosphate 3-epimerase
MNMIVGIMQGRLSNKNRMPLQSFPWDTWEKEFERANKIGFNQIEWLIDGTNDEENPIASAKGRNQILFLAKKYKISIRSICAHNFIDGKLLSDGKSQENEINKLSKILSWAKEINIDYVILPVMDGMSIQNYKAREKLKKILHKVLVYDKPKILLESDLQGIQLKNFVDGCQINNLGVLYDLGNATAMGFDLEKELEILIPYIDEIHIKDRYLNNGSSTRLGEADTAFDKTIKLLTDLKWNKSLVLETPTFDDWKIEAESNFCFIKNLFISENSYQENRS